MGSMVMIGVELGCEYRQRLANYCIEELVESFNREQPIQAWVSARGRYLIALREAFLNTGFDCSTFISESGMSLDYPIEISDQSIVQVVS